ncbi:MAG: PEP-CTERM sorting domain-containing protein [Phycisphaerae bacterium]|nr:PEP-CTERM sorting domain-containing protein [Phycisphaerae bacterium]
MRTTRLATAVALMTCLVVLAPALAVDHYWKVSSGNWSTSSNWTNGEPSWATWDQYAYVNNGGTAQITNSGEGCSHLYVGYASGDSGTVQMSGGSLTSQYKIIGESGTGTFTQTGGTSTVDYFLYMGHDPGGNGTYLLNGGSLSVAWSDYIGSDSTGTATFTHTGGTHTVAKDLLLAYAGSATYSLSDTGQLSADNERIGYGGTGTFTQTGGTNTVTSDFSIGYQSSSTGRYTISNGQLNGSSCNVNYGTFEITGDDAAINFSSYTQNGTGTLESKLDSDGLSTINVTGSATLSGTWDVMDLGDTPMDTFDVLVADGGITGTFDTVNLPPNWTWGIDDGTTLWVTVPEPATLTLLALGGLGLLRRRRS